MKGGVTMADQQKQLRTPGILDSNDNWLVLAECTREGDDWKHKCGEYVLAIEMRATVYDGVFSLSGSGETKPVTVPFCPNCEREPVQAYYPGSGERRLTIS